jgi:probable blue pigment (indigoidine) exporter
MSTGKLSDLLLTGLAPAIWGTTYIVTTEWLPAGHPLFIAMMRALPIGIILSLALRQWPRGIWWLRSAVLGFLNIGLFFVLLFVAATRLPGGITATIGAIQPLIVIALAWLILKEQPNLQKLGFAVLGVAGVALLVFTQTGELDRLGVLAILSATVSMAGGTVLTKKWGRPVPLLSFTAWQLVAGGIVLLPVALIVEGVPSILTARNGLGFLYLGTVNTGLAYTLWFRGIGRLPATTMPMVGLLSPVVAITLGYVLLQQQLALPQIFGATLVLGSVVVSQGMARSAQS